MRAQYRKGAKPRVRVRAQIVLLLAAGYAWAVIAGVLVCRTRTIARWKTRVETEGGGAILGPSLPPAAGLGGWWSGVVTAWVTEGSPRDCGLLRSRWGWGVSVLRLGETHELGGSPAPGRRGLPREQVVWWRPRPGVGPTAPEREAKLQALRQRLAPLPPHESAVCQDEGAINLNPKIGALWLRRGQPAEIPTPGTTQKRYWAGALNWRTGALRVTQGVPKEGRRAALFVRQLDDRRCRVRSYRQSPVLCDNARSQDCQLVPRYLRQGGPRLVLPYLPPHAPDANLLERGWWHRHEAITRCHRCPTLEDLLDVVFAWLPKRARFTVEDAGYSLAQAA